MAPAGSRAEPPGAPAARPTSRLLIVDDDADARLAIRRYARRSGLGIDEAASYDTALAWVDRCGPPTVALCDVRMPGRDGCELAEWFRAEWPETSVIMVSGVTEFPVAIRCLRIGVSDWLTKPLSAQAVHRAIQRGLARTAFPSQPADLCAPAGSVDVGINLWSGVDALLALLEQQDPERGRRVRRRAQLAVKLAIMLELPDGDVDACELAAILHGAAGADESPRADSIRLRRDAELLLALSDAGERVSGVDAPGRGADVPVSRVRFLGEAVARVPALAAAGRLLRAMGGAQASADDAWPAGRVSLGAIIVNIACRYDHLEAGLAAHELPALAKSIDSAPTEQDAGRLTDALRTLGSPDAHDAAVVRWLHESRKTVADAWRSGNPPSIFAAWEAYSHLRGSLSNPSAAQGGANPDSPRKTRSRRAK